MTMATETLGCDLYATNEDNIIDWQGNIIERKDRAKYLMSEVSENVAMTASLQISSAECKMIDDVLDATETSNEEIHPMWMRIPNGCNEVASVLTSVSPLLDDETLLRRLTASAEMSKFKASIGS